MRLVVLLSLCSASPAIGAQAVGGDWELLRTVVGGAGDASMTGPSDRHELFIGEANGETLSGGVYLLLSGFHSQIPLSAPGYMVQSVVSSGNLVSSGMTMVLADDNPVSVRFSNDIDPTSISASAAAVAAVMDAQGNLLANPTPVLIAYDGTVPAMTITPQAGTWNKGYSYELYVSTKIKDLNGDNLPSVATYTFVTVRDPAVANVVALRAQPALRVSVPANAFSAPFVLALSSGVATSGVQSANSKLAALGAERTPVTVIRAEPYDDQGRYVAGIAKSAALSLPYSDADNDGVIDGTRVRANTLSAWRLQEPENLWVKQNGALVDTANKAVVYPTTRFSFYALIGGADNEVKDVFAFPVPFRPNAGATARYGSWSNGIRFANLPSEGTITIYTISGKRVRKLDITSALQSWDARDSGGGQVASGMYLWVVESAGNRKTGKLVIIK